MNIRTFLASNNVYCFTKAVINIGFAAMFFLLDDTPVQYLAIGLVSIITSLLGFIRGIAKSDAWGPQLVDMFPALFYLISGLVICFDDTASDPSAYLSLTCYFMLDAFIGLMMANDVKYYFKSWWISILGVFLALLITFLIIPGYFFALLPIEPLIILFLILEALMLIRVGFLDQKLEAEYKKTVEEIQRDHP